MTSTKTTSSSWTQRSSSCNWPRRYKPVSATSSTTGITAPRQRYSRVAPINQCCSGTRSQALDNAAPAEISFVLRISRIATRQEMSTIAVASPEVIRMPKSQERTRSSWELHLHAAQCASMPSLSEYFYRQALASAIAECGPISAAVGLVSLEFADFLEANRREVESTAMKKQLQAICTAYINMHKSA